MPPHYNSSYYIQIEKALNYWEDGGNGKLSYTPVFKIVDSNNTDIIIRWVENLGKNESAPPKASGNAIPQIENGRFVHVDIVLGVGNYQGAKWIQYGDETMLFIAEHELGHALGLEHSNDKQDIMYPTYEQIGNISPFLLSKYGYLLPITVYAILAIIVFLGVSMATRQRKKINIFNKYLK